MENDRLTKSFIEIPPAEKIEDDFVEISSKGEVTNTLLEFLKNNDNNLRFDKNSSAWFSDFLNSNNMHIYFSPNHPYNTTLSMQSAYKSYEELEAIDHLVLIKICVKKPKANINFSMPNSHDPSLLGLLLFNALKIDKENLQDEKEALDKYTTFQEYKDKIDFSTTVPLEEYLQLVKPSKLIYKTI